MENRVKDQLETEGVSVKAIKSGMNSVCEFIKERMIKKIDTCKMDVANHIALMSVNDKEKILIAMYAEEVISKMNKVGKIFNEILES